MELSEDVSKIDSHILDNALLIVRESVSNALRHGGATEITVRLRQTPDGAYLAVVDNGRGFDPGSVPRGMGINNMEARATDGGGDFSIESSDGRTIIRAKFRRERR